MKPQHAAWAKFFPTQEPKSIGPAIRVLDLPGFRAFEDKLLLYSSHRGPLSPEIERAADDLSSRTFGITRGGTKFEWPEDYWENNEFSEERHRTETRFQRFESRFETPEASDEDTVAILLRFGLDFRDDRNYPLRCTRLFARQAEAAGKGFAGKMPNRAEQGIELWETALLREVNNQKTKLARNSR